MSFGEIETILRTLAGEVKEMCPGNWSFVLANGRPLTVTARAGADWMQLCAVPAMTFDKTDPWDLLGRSARLEGLCKYVLPPRSTQVHLRAEFPLDGQPRLQGYLEAACRGFLAGAATQRCEKSPTESWDGEPLSELCAAAGWPYSEKDEDRGRVELETGDEFHQALVERRDGEIHTWVELAHADSFGKESRAALAVLLLRSAGAIRLARAATRDEGKEVAAGFEVVLAQEPSATDLNHALSALSVACRTCGREAGELQDPELATSYLLLQSESAFENPGRCISTAL